MTTTQTPTTPQPPPAKGPAPRPPLTDQIKLPPRSFLGRVIRVPTLDDVEVDLSLGFGTHVHLRTRVEGVRAADVPPDRRKDAHTCLTAMLGGHRVLVQMSDFDRDARHQARFYVAEYCFDAPPGCVAAPAGIGLPLLEVGAFFKHVAANGYDHRIVFNTVKRRKGR